MEAEARPLGWKASDLGRNGTVATLNLVAAGPQPLLNEPLVSFHRSMP